MFVVYILQYISNQIFVVKIYWKNYYLNYKFIDLVDILAASEVNDDATTNELPQPNRGNKISKKNKKKNKNQDWDDESEGK